MTNKNKSYYCSQCNNRYFGREIIKCKKCKTKICPSCRIENKCVECYVKNSTAKMISEYNDDNKNGCGLKC